MKTCGHSWQYLAEFFWQLQMFQIKLYIIKTHFVFSLFPKIRAVHEKICQNMLEENTAHPFWVLDK